MNHNIAHPSDSKFILLFILVLFSLQSCMSGRDRSIRKWEKHEWKIVKADKNAQPGWIIYSRKIAGTNFLEYKIEGEIQSTPKACLTAFQQELHQLAEDTTNNKYSVYDISEEFEKSLLTYVIHKEPFPLKDTEMRVRYLFFNDEDGTTRVRWQEAWEDYQGQPSKKLKRVESFRGSWNFMPVSHNASQAVNSVQFDPQKMPLWLVEPMVENFLTGGMENLRTMTSGSNEVMSLSK